jgi:hypothetical protein
MYIIDNINLPSIELDKCPHDGDPMEINQEMYFVCERNCDQEGNILSVGVIPLVVRNPKKIKNIKGYINCLSITHRRVRFIKENMTCDFDECDEMIIS